MQVTASGFFKSEPSFAKTLLKLTPIETVKPISSFVSLIIASIGVSPAKTCPPVVENSFPLATDVF